MKEFGVDPLDELVRGEIHVYCSWLPVLAIIGDIPKGLPSGVI